VANNSEAWLKRAKEVIAETPPTTAVSFSISMFSAVYGPQSSQLEALRDGLQQQATSGKGTISGVLWAQSNFAINAISSAIGEIENGLVLNLRAQVAGEVLSELVGLSKKIFEDGTDSAKNVSAVLIAAAFEDLLRRMGSELAGVTGRPDLQDVIIALKKSGILTGGEPGLAQSYLKFRNDSLHADWTNVQPSQVQSCTAFVENLLVKHFS
jgi:hypothetical protein